MKTCKLETRAEKLFITPRDRGNSKIRFTETFNVFKRLKGFTTYEKVPTFLNFILLKFAFIKHANILP